MLFPISNFSMGQKEKKKVHRCGMEHLEADTIVPFLDLAHTLHMYGQDRYTYGLGLTNEWFGTLIFYFLHFTFYILTF